MWWFRKSILHMQCTMQDYDSPHLFEELRTFKLYIIQKFAKLKTYVDYTCKTYHCIVFQCIKDILCTVVMRKYMNVQHNVLSYKPLYNHLGGNWEEFFWTHGFGVEIFGRTSLEHRCGCAIWYPIPILYCFIFNKLIWFVFWLFYLLVEETFCTCTLVSFVHVHLRLINLFQPSYGIIVSWQWSS